MPADDPQGHQEIDPHRDAYVAARDIHVHPAVPDLASPPRTVWGNVPARNPSFTGREELLLAVWRVLTSGDRAVVQALHGMGGVGKSQLVIEYTHRHADEYEVVWWLNAENANLLGEQFAALAAELGCAAPGASLDAMRRSVLMALRERKRCLLVIDNARTPEDVADWLPGGACHVLITSRAQGWHELALLVEVDVLARAESVTILRNRVRGLPEAEAEKVAEAVGDLPLAVAQAAGYIADTGIPGEEYARLLRARATEILNQGRPSSYRLSLTAVTQLAFEQLRGSDPSAAQLAGICAFLAPEIIPIKWFTNAKKLPGSLSKQATDPIAWRHVIDRLRGSALVRLDSDGLLMHRLTQAIIRGHLPSGQQVIAREAAENVLSANIPIITPSHPKLPADPHSWANALPHLLALDPTILNSTTLRNLAAGAWYLQLQGDARAANDLLRQLTDQWRDGMGENHPGTLRITNDLTVALYQLGEYPAARNLDQAMLIRQRRLLGEDHPSTLRTASNLAGCLYVLKEYEAARELHEDTLARRRRVLGESHSDTLRSARNLAEDLRALGNE